jgi:hypothetical protein
MEAMDPSDAKSRRLEALSGPTNITFNATRDTAGGHTALLARDAVAESVFGGQPPSMCETGNAQKSSYCGLMASALKLSQSGRRRGLVLPSTKPGPDELFDGN